MFAWKQYEETKSIVFLHIVSLAEMRPKCPQKQYQKKQLSTFCILLPMGRNLFAPKKLWGGSGEALGRLWGSSEDVLGSSGDALGKVWEDLSKL